MRKLCLLSTLLLALLLCGQRISAQDFSNKGKDFWVAYGYHQIMNAGNQQQMVLYFVTDTVTTTVTVSIPGVGYSQTYSNIPPNTVFTSNPIPKTGAQDARLLAESTAPENKGIHVTADHPVVAYAHIYNSSVSGASILFPTNVLGKEYYSINYTNISNSANANCWFYVVACDTGRTTVEITPSAPTINHPAGVPFTVTLLQGQVFNVMGQFNNTTLKGVDLTGSKVQSISTVNGACKKIGVFSGSGRISITCDGANSSSDNYMVQAFPKQAWGKKFLTVCAGGNQNHNFFRICVSDPTAVVTVNGAPIAVPLQSNFFYDLPITTAPQAIVSDKPVTVAQYLTSQGACGNGTPGDPEVIYLSPVEQNINKVIWNATPNFSISQHYINIVIPNNLGAIGTFKLDGNRLPAIAFTAHPADPNYAYTIQNVSAGQHIVESDSGFNAIAYGFGNAESYGYNAGTNIRDLNQFITISNPHAAVNFPATCKGASFYFTMTFPYEPTALQWVFGTALNAMGIADVTINNPIPSSTVILNGKTLYQYRLPLPYTINTVGTYPIRVIAQTPTPDGCGGEQEVDYDLQVFDTPVAEYNFNTNGCVTTPVAFTDNPQSTSGRNVTEWYWNFGDPNSTSNIANPSHTFPGPGSYNVKHTIVTDVGCESDTLTKVVTIGNLPVAGFTTSAALCEGKDITFTDISTVAPGNSLAKWTWDFGDGSGQVVVFTNAAQVHRYTTAGTYTATLKVETSAGCASLLFSKTFTVYVNPVANFNQPSVCLPAGNAQFNDQSTISDGTQNQFTWAWDFGDGGTSVQQNPLHIYATSGPFSVVLVVTSNHGCTDTKTQSLTTVYPEPQAIFTYSPEVCLGSPATFTDNSNAPNSSIAAWAWDFGDGGTSVLQNPSHTYATAGTFTVTLKVTSAAGCQTVTNIASHNVIVDQLPVVSFTNSNPVCEQSNLLFTSTSVPNGGVFTTYNWSVNASAQPGNAPTMNYTPATPGNYNISLSVTTDKGCSNQFARSVTVNPKPVASFNLPSVCLPSGQASFSSSSTISDGTQNLFTYAWDFGDGGLANTANPVHTYTGTGPYNVSLTVTSNHGCTDDSIRLMNTIYAEPQAAFTTVNEVCLGGSVGFIDNSVPGSGTINAWSWNFGDGNTSNQQSPSHTYATAGSFTVTLNVTTSNGCSTVTKFATKTVVVNPLPTVDFSASLPGCERRNVLISDLSAANAGSLVNWNWNYGDGGGNVVLNSATPFNHVYNTTGNYVVSLFVESDKGCVSPVKTKTVTINATPKAGFSIPAVCSSDLLAPFTDTSRVAAGSITAWEWNFGDPNANAGNPNSSNLQNPTHHFAVAGPYSPTLIVTTNNGCKDTIQQNMIVNGSPTAGFTVQNSTVLCSNKDVVLADGSSVDYGSLIRLEVYWDYANDPTIKTVDNSPVAGKTYAHTYPEFGTPASKTYTVRYVAYSGINCVSTLTKTVTVLATPSLQFSPVTPVCSSEPAFQLNQAVLTNGLPGSGVFSGTGVSSTGLFNPSVSGSGAFVIRYTFTGTNSCSNYVEQTVGINPTPVANAGPDRFVLQGGSATLSPAQNANFPVTYQWSPIIALNNPNVPGAIVTPTDDITYKLTVTSDKGCSSTDFVFVKVLKTPQVPNIFSPNGDGVHDKWEVPYLGSYPGCTIDIYNRYGQLIYHSVGYDNPWDGKVNGKDVPVGTYYYIIDPKNNRQPMSGYVDVIR